MTVEGGAVTVTDPDSGKERTLALDAVYGQQVRLAQCPSGAFPTQPTGTQADQAEVWAGEGARLVALALAGHNTALLAYGQAGAGKRFNVLGARHREPELQGACCAVRPLRRQAAHVQTPSCAQGCSPAAALRCSRQHGARARRGRRG